MEIDDKMLARMARLEPRMIPICQIARAMRLLPKDLARKVRGSITKRKPRNEYDRQELLGLALSQRAGGLLFVDSLGGFDGLPPT